MSGTPFVSLSRAMLKGYFRDRTAMAFSILIPVVFLVLLGSIYKNSSAPQISVIEVGHVALVDHAQADSAYLRHSLKISHSTSLAAAKSAVGKGTDEAAVQQIGNRLMVWYSVADLTTEGVVNTIFSSITTNASFAASGHQPRYSLVTAQVQNSSLKPIQYLAPGLLGWAIASSGAFGAAITLVGWRENKLLRRLRLAPVSTASVVAARISVSVAIAVVQIFVFIAVATTPLFNMKLTGSWWMAIPVVVCGTLAFMSIGLLVGAVAKTQQAATAVANLIILPMAFLGGAFLPLAFAPAWLRDVSYVMPLRYLVLGTQNVMSAGQGPLSAVQPMIILLAFAAVLTLIAVRIFRWDEI